MNESCHRYEDLKASTNFSNSTSLYFWMRASAMCVCVKFRMKGSAVCVRGFVMKVSAMCVCKVRDEGLCGVCV